MSPLFLYHAASSGPSGRSKYRGASLAGGGLVGSMAGPNSQKHLSLFSLLGHCFHITLNTPALVTSHHSPSQYAALIIPETEASQ